MASNIDATKPAQGTASTADVRANFAAAKSEIEALQAAVTSGTPALATILQNIANLSTDGAIEKSGSAVATFTVTATAKTLLDDTTTAAMRTTLGLGSAALNSSADFAAVSHSHGVADLPAMVGDSGAGGTAGLVPAPASGDAAAFRFLMADGTWKTLRGTLGGTLTGNDNEVNTVHLKDYSEAYYDNGNVVTTKTLDFRNGSYQKVTLTGNTSFTFSNWPPTGRGACMIVFVHQNATGGFTATFSGVQWAGGSAPTVGSAANAVSIVSFITHDAGSTVYGFNGGLSFA